MLDGRIVVALCGDHPVKSSICHPSYFATSRSQEGNLGYCFCSVVLLGGDYPVGPSAFIQDPYPSHLLGYDQYRIATFATGCSPEGNLFCFGWREGLGWGVAGDVWGAGFVLATQNPYPPFSLCSSLLRERLAAAVAWGGWYWRVGWAWCSARRLLCGRRRPPTMIRAAPRCCCPTGRCA